MKVIRVILLIFLVITLSQSHWTCDFSQNTSYYNCEDLGIWGFLCRSVSMIAQADSPREFTWVNGMSDHSANVFGEYQSREVLGNSIRITFLGEFRLESLNREIEILQDSTLINGPCSNASMVPFVLNKSFTPSTTTSTPLISTTTTTSTTKASTSTSTITTIIVLTANSGQSDTEVPRAESNTKSDDALVIGLTLFFTCFLLLCGLLVIIAIAKIRRMKRQDISYVSYSHRGSEYTVRYLGMDTRTAYNLDAVPNGFQIVGKHTLLSDYGHPKTIDWKQEVVIRSEVLKTKSLLASGCHSSVYLVILTGIEGESVKLCLKRYKDSTLLVQSSIRSVLLCRISGVFVPQFYCDTIGMFALMPKIDGSTLSESDVTKMNPDEFIATYRKFKVAILEVNSHGYYHGDLNPNNLMLVGSGVRIIDSDLSYALGEEPAAIHPWMDRTWVTEFCKLPGGFSKWDELCLITSFALKCKFKRKLSEVDSNLDGKVWSAKQGIEEEFLINYDKAILNDEEELKAQFEANA